MRFRRFGISFSLGCEFGFLGKKFPEGSLKNLTKGYP
jgi:hypothetical protein